MVFPFLHQNYVFFIKKKLRPLWSSGETSRKATEGYRAAEQRLTIDCAQKTLSFLTLSCYNRYKFFREKIFVILNECEIPAVSLTLKHDGYFTILEIKNEKIHGQRLSS
ncbi:MAG: hypothetical protein IJ530_00290 [Treponema sp.]|uniref:hypothetical protein n=1 Tax=Treponema sp. TaxID=166 RepID=UPI0025E3DF62|nr:hypothetical protein [Treponema sp.]MBQ8678184.1 hypothetical protein [Treponema sp.]